MKDADAEKDRLIKVLGKPFRCDCGCNVFRRIAPFRYRCNGCSAVWISEAVDAAPAPTEPRCVCIKGEAWTNPKCPIHGPAAPTEPTK